MRPPHNIAGSEAFTTRRPLIISERARPKAPMALATRIYLVAFIAAVIAGLIDVLIGQPVCLTIGVIAFLILWLRR